MLWNRFMIFLSAFSGWKEKLKNQARRWGFSIERTSNDSWNITKRLKHPLQCQHMSTYVNHVFIESPLLVSLVAVLGGCLFMSVAWHPQKRLWMRLRKCQSETDRPHYYVVKVWAPDQRSLWINVNQRIRWIHSGYGFINFFDASRCDPSDLGSDQPKGSYNLGQNKWNIWTTPPPHFNDAKMARFLLLRAFIIALGGKGVNCSFLFCPRFSEIHTGVTRCVIYGIGGNIVAVARVKVSLSIRTQILRWKHTQTRLKKWFYDT